MGAAEQEEKLKLIFAQIPKYDPDSCLDAGADCRAPNGEGSTNPPRQRLDAYGCTAAADLICLLAHQRIIISPASGSQGYRSAAVETGETPKGTSRHYGTHRHTALYRHTAGTSAYIGAQPLSPLRHTPFVTSATPHTPLRHNTSQNN